MENTIGQTLPGKQPAIKQAILLFPPQSEHAHGSSIVQLSNGDVLAAWFQGSGERKADDVLILGARLKKGGSVNFYMFHGGTNFGFYKYEYTEPGNSIWKTIAGGNEPKVEESIGAFS